MARAATRSIHAAASLADPSMRDALERPPAGFFAEHEHGEGGKRKGSGAEREYAGLSGGRQDKADHGRADQ